MVYNIREFDWQPIFEKEFFIIQAACRGKC